MVTGLYRSPSIPVTNEPAEYVNINPVVWCGRVGWGAMRCDAVVWWGGRVG